MAEPRTYFDYEADADKISNGFPIAFDYLEDEHVTVEVDGAENTNIELTTSTPVKVRILSGVTEGQNVRVRRKSQPDQDLVDFVNGSVLTESELDRAYLHNRYLAEESAEQNDISLRVKAGADGQFDALNKKIINVSDPTANQDAATKNYVDGVIGDVAVGALPDGSITAAKLDTDSVTNAKIEDNAVTAAKLDTDSVTTAKIEDNAVTAAKISSTDSTFSIDGSGNMGLGIAANAAAKLYIAGTGGNTFLAVKSDTMAAIDLEDSGAGVDQKHYQMVSLDGAFELRQINDDLTLKATPLKVDLSGNIDASGVYKVGGFNLLLDEDTMTSNSATQGATQQSIKTYVDTQVAASTVSKFDSGWASSFGGTTVANNADMTVTHNLSTTAVIVAVYVNSSASDTNAQLVNTQAITSGIGHTGYSITSLSSTSFTLSLCSNGYLDLDVTTGNSSAVAYTSKFLKVVVIG